MEHPTPDVEPASQGREQSPPSSPTTLQPPLGAMLQLLREQEEERRIVAVSLAESLLRSCTSADGGGGAREKAQATVHEALRCAKANSGNKMSNEQRTGSTWPLEGQFLDKGSSRLLLRYFILEQESTTIVGTDIQTSPTRWRAVGDRRQTCIHTENNRRHGNRTTLLALMQQTARSFVSRTRIRGDDTEAQHGLVAHPKKTSCCYLTTTLREMLA